MDKLKLNITQLNTLVKRIIDAEEFLQTISVYGEVSNFKISAGNAYFDIKENGAQLACIKFGASNLDIKNGDMVLLTGRLNYYVKTGRLSYVANIIEPYGIGELYKQYLALKEKLATEGLFDERYKKQLPKFANKVGVVTSETGAVIRDIVHVAKKKNPFTDIIVYPARVQGIGAEAEIIAGLKYFEESDVDVVIIARGGGSFEDLSPFNTESLVRQIFMCKKPVISAVGHETDFSLSDFVSDMRAPTPSVAAEIAFYDYNKIIADINSYINSIFDSSHNFIKNKTSQLLENNNIVLQSLTNIKNKENNKLEGSITQVQNAFQNIINNNKFNLEKTMLVIEKSNPLNILKQGYAMAKRNGETISSVNNIQNGDIIDLTFSDGYAKAQIINKENK